MALKSCIVMPGHSRWRNSIMFKNMFKKMFMTTSLAVGILLMNTPYLFAQSESPTRSVNFGPNAKNFGIVGVTKDFLLNDHFSLFVTGGLTSPFIGGGAAYYVKSYHKSSF